jgi:DNA-binding NarL/FixJ family response regulator
MEKKKPRILIIEDDEYSHEAIEHLLNAKGCEIISTAERRGVGEEAGSCTADKAKAGSQARLFSSHLELPGIESARPSALFQICD